MSKNIPEAPTTPGATPKKDHTAAIVVTVVILFVVVIPTILGAIFMFKVFDFVESHLGDTTISDIIKDIESMESGDGIQLTSRESTAVRNIVSQIENKAIDKRSIAKADCQYMERIASYYSTDKDKSGDIKLCDGENVYGAIRKISTDEKTKNDEFNYALILKNDVSCGYFLFNKSLSARKGFSRPSLENCMETGLDDLKLIDTKEELEAYPDFVIQDDDDDDDDVDIRINIKNRA